VLAEPRALEGHATIVRLREILGAATDREFAVLLGIGFVCVLALANAINLIGNLAIQRFSARVGDRLHAALLEEYLHRDYRFHARVGTEHLFTRVVFWIQRITIGVIDSAISLITNAVALIVIVGSVVWVNPWLALWASAWLGGGYALLYSGLRRHLARIGAEESQLIEARTRIATGGLTGIKEVLVLGKQRHFVDSFARSCETISLLTSRLQTITRGPRYALEAVTIAGLVAASIFLSGRSPPGVWLAEMTFLGFAAYRLLPTAQQVYACIVRIRHNRQYLDEVADDLACSGRRADEGAQAVAMAAPRDSISLEVVCFKYSRDAAPALHDVSVHIPAGTIAGFTGPNGCGKTTLIDLVAGLLEPDSGCIRIDGSPLDARNRAAWQRAIAYVPQQIYLFDGTLAENIAFGSTQGTVDRARVVEVAGLAELDETIAWLPRGLDERLGGGARGLSGGERQRVAIARALYREAPVLILDEFTSALDGAAERNIIEMLKKMRGDRTVLVVTHRSQTLRACDHVFEMAAGTIVQRGSYADFAGSSRRAQV
jgi:HlyD family secretion protein